MRHDSRVLDNGGPDAADPDLLIDFETCPCAVMGARWSARWIGRSNSTNAGDRRPQRGRQDVIAAHCRRG